METVVVYTTYDDIEAEMLRGLLENNSIECQVVSEITHAVFPLTRDHRLARIRVIVSEQEAQRAEEIIEGFLNSPESSFTPEELQENDDSDQDVR